MSKRYTDEKTALIVLAMLKKYGIRRVIASPGSTNAVLVGSMQSDPYFEMYSSVDERSAAYMACGLAAESGEPVVISCTGATASRNYLPGLTEAFYRKLPIVAITSTQRLSRVGHHIAQVIDRSTPPNDTVNITVTLPLINDEEDWWDCEMKLNRALLELTRRGGGPVHINLPTVYSNSFNTKTLPIVRRILRVTRDCSFPDLPEGRIGIFIGAHLPMSAAVTAAIDKFCAVRNAVVFCDHTSGYKGRFRILSSLIASQNVDLTKFAPDLLIHMGEITGDYYTLNLVGKEVWRVNPDGEIRDTFRKLTTVFELAEKEFFEHYSSAGVSEDHSYYDLCRTQYERLSVEIPEMPLSNPWIAMQLAGQIPPGSVLHFGILNCLRTWNFFEVPADVQTFCNVGGFGIDGCVSSLLGASLANPNKIYFGVFGDLALFYDINCLGNRHLGRNVRLILVNNGKGTEFRQSSHVVAHFGESADKFIAAAGHNGNKSPMLIKGFTEALGFEYLSASNKEEFCVAAKRFVTPNLTDRPMLFEVFTTSDDESDALEQVTGLQEEQPRAPNAKAQVGRLAKAVLGEKGVNIIKRSLGK